MDAHQTLREIRRTLETIGGLIAIAVAASSVAAQSRAGSRDEITRVSASIDEAVRSVEEGAHRHGPSIRVVNVDLDLENYYVEHATLPHHGPLDVIVDVRASAQTAGLLLSFSTLNLSETFSVQITGKRGAAEITVVSGTPIWQVHTAFATVAQLTGVTPYWNSDSSLLLRSYGLGSDEFVSVRLLHPFSAPGPAGVYQTRADNFLEADPASRVPFDSPQAFEGVRDDGQDLQALINGYPATGQGPTLIAWSPHLRMFMTLEPGPGQHLFRLGPFRAFTILRE